MKLVIASKNRDKIREIAEIFRVPGIELISAADIEDLPDVIEDSSTFQGNAVKKALTLALATGEWTMADDSGLEVDALDGAPGVHSARYAGEMSDSVANNKKLLEELEDKSSRTARFRCVIALCSPKGMAQTVEGVCEGEIISEPRGSNGFGYDPLFVPTGFRDTFAELVSEIKNKISHRAMALTRARNEWESVFVGSGDDWPERSFKFDEF